MTAVSVTEARHRWLELVERAAAGERMIITKAGRPVAVLQAYEERPKRRVPGVDAGLKLIGDDWDDPIPGFEEYV